MKTAVSSAKATRVVLRRVRTGVARTASFSLSNPSRARRLSSTTPPKRRILPRIRATYNGAGSATSAEEVANKRRWEESGNKEGSVDDWKWTLNWNEISDNITVGSCPRSKADMDRIVDEAGATAVLSVQSDLCLEAMQVDYQELREHALTRGLMITRVPIRDFDHGDQTLMLPEAVRTLALLVSLNYKVYVHCTAGINRATLTVLGYMTFVQGWDLYTALKTIKAARPQANPYIDCWKDTKTRLLEGRSEEVIALSRKFFLKDENGMKGDSFSNWVAAEDLVIKETFRRFLSNSVDAITALTDLKAESLCSICINPDEIDRANAEIENLQYELSIQRKRLGEATASLEAQRLEHLAHTEQPVAEEETYETINGQTESVPDLETHPTDTPPSSLMVYDELVRVKEEISALKKCIREIAMVSTRALSIDSMDSFDAEWEGEDDDQATIDLHSADTTEEDDA